MASKETCWAFLSDITKVGFGYCNYRSAEDPSVVIQTNMIIPRESETETLEEVIKKNKVKKTFKYVGLVTEFISREGGMCRHGKTYALPTLWYAFLTEDDIEKKIRAVQLLIQNQESDEDS